MLNYNKLNYFVTVVQYLNISRAAKALHIGQPALSTHIKDLERELGTTLFLRSNRQLTLTKAGQLLYDETHDFFEREEELVRMVQNAAVTNQTLIRIGTLGADVIYRLPFIIQKFKEQFTNVQVEVERMNLAPISKALESQSIDIGFQMTSEPFISYQNQDKYEAVTIQRGHTVVAMSAINPLAKKELICVKDLKNCKIAVQERREFPVAYLFLQEVCRKEGFKPNIVAEYTYVEPLLTEVSMSDMVTITLNLAPIKGLENLRLVEFEKQVPVSIDMIWKKNSENPAVLPFVRHVAAMQSIFSEEQKEM